MILCDTGVLLCLVDPSQPQHQDYKQLVMRLRKPLITTWACLTEVMYLSLGRGGWRMQQQVAKYLLDELLTIYDIQSGDYTRLFELMAKYQDRPMDLADATLVLTAEKIGTNQILTLDSLSRRSANETSYFTALPIAPARHKAVETASILFRFKLLDRTTQSRTL